MTGSSSREALRLYVMPYSPWSERARWALLHHRLPFQEVVHTPLVGELAIRMRARQLTGKVTVPLLRDGKRVVMDSLRIAEYADSRGHGTRLFPEGRAGDIARLNERAEVVFRAGRLKLLELGRVSDEIAREFLPPPLRALPFAATSSRLGSRFIARKHGAAGKDADAVIRNGFLEVRQLLEGRAFVFDAFSYADILAATTLQFLKPVEDRYVPLGPRTREGLTNPELVREFADLVAWRDALYAAHRPI
jgi:glutathione S-transferase